MPFPLIGPSTDLLLAPDIARKIDTPITLATTTGDVLAAESVSASFTPTSGVLAVFGEGGNDSLFGGAGNDTLTGGDGDDQMFGEAGDDRFIWNPGDDTDLAEGGDGLDTLEVNGGNGAEVFAVTANGTRFRADRV